AMRWASAWNSYPGRSDRRTPQSAPAGVPDGHSFSRVRPILRSRSYNVWRRRRHATTSFRLHPRRAARRDPRRLDPYGHRGGRRRSFRRATGGCQPAGRVRVPLVPREIDRGRIGARHPSRTRSGERRGVDRPPRGRPASRDAPLRGRVPGGSRDARQRARHDLLLAAGIRDPGVLAEHEQRRSRLRPWREHGPGGRPAAGSGGGTMKRLRERPTDGFSLVEVIIATLILSVGLLAMAGTMGHFYKLVRQSGYRTERTMAVQEVTERLRAMPYDLVTSRAPSSAEQVGEFRIWWNVTEPPVGRVKVVEIISSGPGYGTREVIDTTVINLLR